MEVHDRNAFRNAGEALREIPIVHLPDFEVVKPVLEMRDLILAADEMIAQICKDYHTEEGDWQEGLDRFRDLHRRADKYVSTVEDAVRRVRDGD